MAQASATSGYGIEDVYKSVISDVINNIKEIFLDESIDIDVLSQLKSEWENKVNASGALDFDGNRSIPPPAVRQPQVKQQPISQVTQQPMPQTFVPQSSAPGPSNFIQQSQRINPGFVQSGPGPSNFAQVQMSQQRPVSNIQQPTQPAKSDYVSVKKPDYAGVKQLDGGGPGMTDSSSEDDDQSDDQMTRFIGLEDERAEDAEGVEEDPLNSADDQSDDEDLETLFQADNVIVCQFEKVNRARTKWKFTLKDGIMHLNGKDYCFQKAVGEAEW